MCQTFSKQFSNHLTGQRLLPNILNFEDPIINYHDSNPSKGIKKILNNKSKDVHPFESYYNKSEVSQKRTINIKSKSDTSRSKDTKNKSKETNNISKETHPHYGYANSQTSMDINTYNNKFTNDIYNETTPYISSDYFMPYDNLHTCSIPVEIPIDDNIFDKENITEFENKNVVLNNYPVQVKDILIDINENLDVNENNFLVTPALFYDSLKNTITIDIINKDAEENHCVNKHEENIESNTDEPIKIESDGNMININNILTSSSGENINELNSNEEITDIEKKVELINIDNDNYNINKNYINKDNMNKEYMNTENSLEVSRSTTGINLEESRFDLSDKNLKLKELSVSDVNVSLKVVGELKEGSKLKIVDNSYLAEDNDGNGYLGSFRRSMSGQSRDKIVVFLQHLFEETKRNHLKLLAEIRKGEDTANKMPELRDLFGNMIIFLHKYEVMRNVYKTDSGTYAKLGEIRNNFFHFRESFFKELCVPGSQ
uniref:Uncharacterized protein n=1 Tax=Moumouvirus sp. 'Monve' TaxID=1128131 RepID=H2EDX7_9VIRU|nr:hypothetical protein mv_L395 [Moumouvirus Monve]